jgi:hypothetical protein
VKVRLLKKVRDVPSRLSPVEVNTKGNQMGRKKVEKKTIETGIAQYAVYCCNVLYHIKDVDFKRCRRCGKILKDITNDK